MGWRFGYAFLLVLRRYYRFSLDSEGTERQVEVTIETSQPRFKAHSLPSHVFILALVHFCHLRKPAVQFDLGSPFGPQILILAGSVTMAVLEELKGIEVQIRSAGAPLQEYTDRFAEPGPNNPLADVTVVRYVEAVSDERFSVLLSVLPAYISGGHALVFTLSIDGDQIRMTTDGDLKKNHGGWCWEERGFYGKINGTAMLRHFKFSKIDMGMWISS